MMAHAMAKAYGLEEPYLCLGCGLTIQRHGDFPHGDGKEGMHDYQWTHFGQRHRCPHGFIYIEPENMIGDTMHAGIQICPHVVWHTVHTRCKDKQTTRKRQWMRWSSTARAAATNPNACSSPAR
eukprot:jgi/Tetstr1/434164/TSEL_002488.t1